MNLFETGPILIVISRDEVRRQDISGPLMTLKHLIADRDSIRDNMLNVDVSFAGYESTREELFEIPDVRSYVHALDAQFPFWLYFLSRQFTGLQCLAYCYLPPFLTPDARAMSHPKLLVDLIERRWAPALFQLCSLAGHTEAEADDLLESAMEYFASGPSAFEVTAEDEDEDDERDAQQTRSRLALRPSQEFVKLTLESACRAVLARPDQDPHSLLLGALFLRAVRALPIAIDQFPIQLSWKIDYGESWGKRIVTIGHESLSLETIEAFNSGHGWDHESTVDWVVDESRQQGLDEWVLEDMLTAFARDLSDPGCVVYFSTDSDHAFEAIANDPEPLNWHEAFDEDDA